VAGPVELNEPQALAAQATDHLTPALLESLVRVTVSDAVAFTGSEDGTMEEKEMESGARVGLVLIEEETPQDISAALVYVARNSKTHRWIDIVAPQNPLITSRSLLARDLKSALWCLHVRE
jgi:hypothetical protein